MESANIEERLGLAIKRWRHRLELTQEELASRAGLHRTYVSDVERGVRNLSLASIQKLAQGLRISLATLFAEFTDGPGETQATTKAKIPSPGENGDHEHRTVQTTS